jgi:cation diffusion facilitator family transporter
MQQEITAKKVILTSILVDILDIITNVVIAIVTGSVVMAVESIQGFADLTAAVLLYVGFKKSLKNASPSHPLGYGREIYFWTLISSLIMLAFTATITFYLGFLRFLHPQDIDNIYLAFGVLVFSILTNGYALSLDVRRLSSNTSKWKIFKSFFHSEHIETKATFVLDLMGTSVAVFGFLSLVILKITQDNRFDGVGAMIMGSVLAILSFVLFAGAKDFLIGRSAPKGTTRKIEDVISMFKMVKKIRRLQTVYEGSSRLLLLLDLHLENDLTTDQIEKLTEDIKDEIKKTVPAVFNIQIEITK